MTIEEMLEEMVRNLEGILSKEELNAMRKMNRKVVAEYKDRVSAQKEIAANIACGRTVDNAIQSTL